MCSIMDLGLAAGPERYELIHLLDSLTFNSRSFINYTILISFLLSSLL
jgi:hypothetical protein